MTPKNQSGPNYSDLARIVIERANTAREGVDLIAQLIAEHGYSSYGGNSHLIADPDEAWVVIEFAGGKGLWVAERLGPDSIRASRPGYIGNIPSQPNDDFLFPAHFFDTATEHGWHDPADGVFNVNAIYGDGKHRWAGVKWIESVMRERAEQPQKISLKDVFWSINTQKLTGDTAGYGRCG
jgi:dipeptidase